MDDSLYGIMLGNGRDVLHAYFSSLMFCFALFFCVDFPLFFVFAGSAFTRTLPGCSCLPKIPT